MRLASSAAGFGGFRPAAFRFLRDLARNNERAWFEAHRDVYEREVREPMRRLVETLDAELASIAPEIVGADVDGKPMKLSDFRGKVVALDFFGFW